MNQYETGAGEGSQAEEPALPTITVENSRGNTPRRSLNVYGGEDRTVILHVQNPKEPLPEGSDCQGGLRAGTSHLPLVTVDNVRSWVEEGYFEALDLSMGDVRHRLETL